MTIRRAGWRRLRVVIDTNVIVSALLDTSSVPGQVLELAVDDSFDWLVDARIVAEYRDVLPRPKFGFAAADFARALQVAEHETVRVVAHPLALSLPDPSDLPFVEVAVSGGADALVTGNIKDYQIRGGGKLDIAIVTPRQFLDLLARR